MRVFLIVAAILVAMGNMYVLTTSEDLTDLSGHDWSELPSLLIAAVPGVLIVEILLRLARPALEGRFLLRYAMMVSAVCLGGALYGALLPFGVLFDGSYSLLERFLLLVGASAVGALIGAILGAVEGLILGSPLAGVLGLFRSRG